MKVNELIGTVDKRKMLEMQSIVLDVDPDADVNLIRGTEVKQRSDYWKQEPWVIEVTFSNGAYRIFGANDCTGSDGKLDVAAFTKKIQRHAPGSRDNQENVLRATLKREFPGAVNPGPRGIIVYKSQAVRDAYTKAYVQARRAKAKGVSPTIADVRAKYNELTRDLPRILKLKVVAKAVSQKYNVNGYGVFVTTSNSTSADFKVFATVPEALAALDEFFEKPSPV